ncbi:MAG: hypothetical protein R3286_12005 [Gammaproteobacteria bacterium]|nr:hypothetical protein [Gammaproteobacteria bacterium]
MKRGRRSSSCSRLGALVALVLLSVTSLGAAASEQLARAPRGTSAETRIGLFLDHPAVLARIHATGMRAAEIRRDLSHLSLAERDMLAELLERGWPGHAISRQVTLTADYLMLVALMRESRLFVSVVTPLATTTD